MTVSISQEHTFTGRWSRVGGATRDIPGSLTFTPEEGAHLKLDGVFDAQPAFSSVGSGARHTIHGVTNAGKQITIFNCLLRRQTWSSGYPVSEYGGPLIAIGGHFESYDALRFKTVLAAFHNLEEILGLSGINEGIESTVDGPPRITLAFTQPSPLRADLPPFSIATAFSCAVEGDMFERRGFFQQGHLVVSTREEKHLEDFLNGPVRSLHNLIELAADTVLPLTALEATEEPLDNPSRATIDLLLQPPRYRVRARRKHPAEVLFTLAGLKGRFEECVQRWHAGRERYGPTFDLFFSLGRSEMFMEHQFLSLIQAVEAYHRRAHPNVAIPQDEHDARVHRVLAAVEASEHGISDSEKRWLRSKLQYNEPTLTSRLEAMYDGLPAAAKAALPSRSQFVHETAQTRHHMTHWSSDQRPGTLRGGAQLLRGVQQLRLILKCVFLAEMGLTDRATVEQIPEIQLLRILREPPES